MMVPRSFFYSRRQPGPPTTTTTKPIATSKLPSAKRKDDLSTKKDVASPTKPTNVRTPPKERPMGKRKGLQSEGLSPPSGSPPSTTMTNAVARPNTRSSAVQIPIKSKQDAAHMHRPRPHPHAHRKHSSPRRNLKDAHSPDTIPPSVAALLAITSIPPPNRRGSSRQGQSRDSSRDSRMTVDSIVPRSQVSEKDLSQELSEEFARDLSDISITSYDRSPMDVLLSPPDELDEDDESMTSDSAFTSLLSTRAASFESVPSLGDSLGTSFVTSIDSPVTPRGRRIRPPRRSLEPVSSPPGERPDHPLSSKSSLEVDQLDFRVFNQKPGPAEQKQTGLTPLKSVFKSNLTASLRALRLAARSISSFTASSIPPDDFLTRSILTIDPRVPFTDERMPPVLGEEPSEAMRRYLNPTTSLRPESRVRPPIRSYTASIQMQTYKIQRSRSAPAASRSSNQSSNSNKPPTAYVFPPGPRQREIRENSDFIRIAVLEHLMRKRGKLDDQREGHARWLLPPRKSTNKPYEIGTDGIPARWVAISQDVM
ncbi:uncharacterized protein F4822DRAFT_375758 [Hypoxylon trugodes]|uniref:uncharacterized protein n=1 Tax=Hypoxylon trugodes TaxID=326681 RepID=UPI00218F6E03|nr:uncharacterized protein F4822DRAFT_375758 [Hypoxylon trugodes]KAI1384873.1 hypothetical protein F4822DRAFT_375758 [Hypoxylon trugodes]